MAVPDERPGEPLSLVASKDEVDLAHGVSHQLALGPHVK